MRNVLRILSLLFFWILKINPGQWLMVILLLWWGWIKSDPDVVAAIPWWTGAGVMTVLSLAARAYQYTLFVRSEHEPAGTCQPPRKPLRAKAAGYFLVRGAYGLPYVSNIVNNTVQVRWMSESRPPMLALLDPPGLDPKLYAPVDAAERFSLWYPGSELTRGMVYIAGKEYPGVRLWYLGRQILLGLADEGAVAEVAGTLT